MSVFWEDRLGSVNQCAARGRAPYIDGNTCPACTRPPLGGCPEFTAERVIKDYLALEDLCRTLIDLHDKDDDTHREAIAAVRADLQRELDAIRGWKSDLAIDETDWQREMREKVETS